MSEPTKTESKTPLVDAEHKHVFGEKLWVTDTFARSIELKLAEAEKERDEEFRRWQDAIRDKLIAVVGIDIDGAGCDSGDPLDLTLAEVSQGLNHLIDALDAQTEAAQAMEKDKERLDWLESGPIFVDCRHRPSGKSRLSYISHNSKLTLRDAIDAAIAQARGEKK